jgi:phage-related protein
MDFRIRFDVVLMNDAVAFIESLDPKVREKVIYNLDKSRYVTDPKLLKKLDQEIWEFRTRAGGTQIRLLAFWDHRDDQRTLVIVTHGLIKKTQKLKRTELNKAVLKRREYLSKDEN